MYNDEVMLADFGTTSLILNSESVNQTVTQRHTRGYSAPEISEEYFVTASDYYSLGCTIATLYNKGKHIYHTLIDSKDFWAVTTSMRTKRLPLGCPDSESALQKLVDALVMHDPNMRAGFDDVNLWLKNPDSFDTRWKIKSRQSYDTSFLGFNFMDKTYNNKTELTNAMLIQWNDGKRYLYKGHIANFFGQSNPSLSDKATNIVENKETARNEDLGLAMFLHYLNTSDKSSCPIYWRGDTYSNLSDISIAISTGKADENKIISMLKDKYLSWKLSNTQGYISQDTINEIKEIEEITAIYPQLGYYAFMYIFDPKRGENIKTADSVFKDISGESNEWYEKSRKLINSDKELACLLNIVGKNHVMNLKGNLTENFISDDSKSDLTLLYLLFEGVCEDKIFIREHFLRYSSQSYLYWFQQNLNLYSFNSVNAKELEKRIKNVKIDKTMSISDILSGFTSLRQYLKDFIPLLQNNYLLPYMGLGTNMDKTGITTNYSYAFFAGNFKGINVPIGYLKSIGI